MFHILISIFIRHINCALSCPSAISYIQFYPLKPAPASDVHLSQAPSFNIIVLCEKKSHPMKNIQDIFGNLWFSTSDKISTCDRNWNSTTGSCLSYIIAVARNALLCKPSDILWNCFYACTEDSSKPAANSTRENMTCVIIRSWSVTNKTSWEGTPMYRGGLSHQTLDRLFILFVAPAGSMGDMIQESSINIAIHHDEDHDLVKD